MGSSKNKKTGKRSNDNAREKRNKKSWQEKELVKHNEVDIDDNSGNKNARKQHCEQNHDDEQGEEIETTSNNNNNEEQQKSTQHNKNKNNNDNDDKELDDHSDAKHSKHDSDLEDNSSGSDGSSYHQRASAEETDEDEEEEEELAQKRKQYLKQRYSSQKVSVDGSNSHHSHALSNSKSGNREKTKQNDTPRTSQTENITKTSGKEDCNTYHTPTNSGHYQTYQTK